MKNEPSAIEALDKLKGLCALKEFNVNDVHDCYSIIRAALNRDEVDLESLYHKAFKSMPNNAVFDRASMIKGLQILLNELKKYKGKIIK